MIETKKWNEVVQQIQHSGSDLMRRKAEQSRQRNLYLQHEWIDQMNESRIHKQQIEKEKPIQRKQAEQMDKIAKEKQYKIKEEARERELLFKNENFRIIKQKQKTTHQMGQSRTKQVNMFKQNPVTNIILSNFDHRKRRSRQVNQEDDKINSELISYRNKIAKQIKQLDNNQGRQFQRQVEQRFKKIQEQRYKFKKACLEGSGSSIKLGRIATQPDSLQKQYGKYLKQQMAQKNNSQYKYTSNKVSPHRRDDQISDKNILRLNYNVQKQSSSPAYLGRIPLNYDRQKQLNYLDKNIYNRHQRTKTQFPLSQTTIRTHPLSEQLQKQKSTHMMMMPQASMFDDKNNKNIQNFNNNNMKNIIEKKLLKQEQMKSRINKIYKQYNVLTGNPIIRSQY